MKRILGIFGVGVLLLVVNTEASVNSNRNFWKLPWGSGSYDQASPASGSDDLTFDGSGFDKDDKVTSGVHEDDEDYDGSSGDSIIDLTPDDDDDDDDDSKKDDDYYIYEDKDDKKNKPSDDEDDDDDMLDGSGSGDDLAPIEEVIVPDNVGVVDAKKPTTTAPKKQLSPCEHLQKEAKNVESSFMPECESDGAFKNLQCMDDAGTGKRNCWCVDPRGIEIMGTRMAHPKVPGCLDGTLLTECVKHLLRNSKEGLLGAFKPQCSDEGEYEPVQCHGSECWCVDSKGNEIVGTVTNRANQPKCPTESNVVDKPSKPDNTANLPKSDDGYTVSGNTKEDIDNVIVNIRPEIPDEENTFDESEEERTNNIGESYATIKQNEAILRQPGLLAAIIGGAVVGLLCMVLLVMFIVYRMRKKDEGSYPLDEQKYQNYSYSKAPDKEFYA